MDPSRARTFPVRYPEPRQWTRAALWLVRLYAVALGASLIVRFGVGDRSAWSFALNALLLYAFSPLPVLSIVALLTRGHEARVVCLVGVSIWVSLWGELFVPRFPGSRAAAANTGRRLTVLSYNALGFNRDAADTVRIVRESAADVVALQELNPETAALLERELGSVYPFRWMEPRAGVVGGGLLSKDAFERKAGPSLETPWVGTPMAIEIRVGERAVTVLRFHAVSGPRHYGPRERQGEALAEYARAHRGSLVIVGDLNATDQNTVYARITERLQDAWREAGWGFGHTFPGVPTAKTGGARPTLLGVPVPMWLVRIDYVFHSPDLRALDAKLALYNGRSDHRGVIATFAVP